jgi:flagellar hook-basal body complex protein FliE
MIKTIGQMQQTLGNHGAAEWTRQVGDELTAPLSMPGETKGVQSFGDFLRDSLSQVNGMQNEANVAMEKLASGESRDLHETLLTVERAEIAFKAMNQVRSKVIDAYKEIMRMQI